MKDILENYRQGIGGRVALHDNGLIWASSEEVPLTWMNSTIDGRPVTPRNGYQIEVNALWYNAVCYALELAGKYGDKTDKAFVKVWTPLPARTQESFLELFRLPEGYLADFIVLTDDLFSVDEKDILSVKVEKTFLGGEEVYSR